MLVVIGVAVVSAFKNFVGYLFFRCLAEHFLHDLMSTFFLYFTFKHLFFKIISSWLTNV